MTHEISKALEVWILQNVLNFSLILGMIALGLALIQPYFDALRERLTLRVSVEIWDVFTILVVDLCLAAVVIVGYFVLNPDIMADIKVALPFVPAATILFAVSLVLRLFHGGHQDESPNFRRSLWLMFAANALNVIGFTFVMEAASGEYLEKHPSAFWMFLKTKLRSNANLELTELTFWVFFPLLLLVFFWGFFSAVRFLRRRG